MSAGGAAAGGILLAGLPTTLAAPLADRFQGLTVQVAFAGEDVMSALEGGGWSLLVIDHGLPGMSPGEVMRWIRTQGHLAGLRTVYTIDLGAGAEDAAALEQIGSRLAPDRILLHPLDRGELLRHAGDLLGASAPEVEPGTPPPAASRVADAVAAVWERSRGTVVERIRRLEGAAAALEAGTLRGPERNEAEREAHRLAGTLGTFGFPEGSRLAFRAEALLASGSRLGPADGERLRGWAEALREEVARAPARAEPVAAAASVPPARPLVLVVDDDRAIPDLLRAPAEAAGMELAWAPEPGAVREALGSRRPSVVLLDLTFPHAPDAGEAFLRRIAAGTPPVPVLVMTARTALVDRVRVVQAGARGFLPKPFDPARAIARVARHLPSTSGPPRRVLAVDDDAAMLEAIRAMLTAEGMAVETLDDPLRFWTVLEAFSPDLVMLDADMPSLSGIELCRVLRSDVGREELPVLFLTARTDADTVRRVFAAGADDYVPKPLVGPELLTRIRNRLDRARAVRESG